MSALLDSNPEYQAVTVMKVDYDEFGTTPFTKNMGVRNRATLVMFNKGEEVGRIEWSSRKADIEGLFKSVV